MPKNLKGLLTDGQASFIGGNNSGTHPSLLKSDEVSFSLNVTLRGGFPRSRPKFMLRALTYQSDEQSSWFKTHLLQGAEIFSDMRGDGSQIVSVAGRLFRVDMAWRVTEITPRGNTSTTADFIVPATGQPVNISVADATYVFAGYPIMIAGGEYMVTSRSGNALVIVNNTAAENDSVLTGAVVCYLSPNNPNKEQAWMQQHETWFVVQNNLDGAILFNGSTCRRANILGSMPEVPTGSMMESAEGRLWVVVNNRQVAAGDLYDSFDPDSAIRFAEEVESLALSGRFVMPSHLPITGIRVIPNLDTSQGQGPLLVFTQDIVGSINVPFNRSLWKTVQYAIVRLVQSNYGGTSHESIVVVNGDIWNRSQDGIRTFIMASAAFNEWGNVPQSREVQRDLDQDTPELLRFSSGALFDNRLLMTFGPQRTPNGVKHRGVVAMDFDIISALTKKDNPLYDGVWTGINPTRLVSGMVGNKQRCFAWCLNSDNENELWELTDEFGFDNDANRIRSAVEFRSMNFKNDDIKKLSSFEAWIDKMVGQVDFSLYWRPDYTECWFPWRDKQLCSQYQDCSDGPEVCKTFKAFQKGYKTRVGFGQPPDLCEPGDNKPARIGYRHQTRLEWIGQCALKEIVVRAEEVPDYQYPPC